MASKKIIGLAFDGMKAGWIVRDPSAPASAASKVSEYSFERAVSQLIGEGAESAASAGAELKEALGGIKGDVAVSLPSDQALLRILDLPTSDPEEIRSMVNLQIDKMSPFPIENMVVGHEVVARRENGVVVAGIAVRRDLVHNAGELLKAADIVPVRVDINSLVWWRLIKGSDAVLDSGRQVFIVMGETAAEFIVVQDGVPILFRAFMRQDGQADTDFMSEICDELGYTLMSLELEHGAFIDFSVSIWHTGVLDEDVLSRPREMSGGNLEIKSMDTLPGLAEAVAARSVDPGAIDLTPAELIDARRKLVFRKKLITALSAVGAVWLLSLAVLFGGVAFQKFRMSKIEAKIEGVSEAAMEVREIRRKVRTIGMYTDRSRSALECLREISLKQPGGVELTVLNYKKGESVRISGEASGVNAVYDFKKNMDSSKLFEAVSLDGPKRSRGKEVFEIEAELRGIRE